jgi:WD40 repeat protein
MAQRGHKDAVSALTWTSDGKRLASGSASIAGLGMLMKYGSPPL